MKYRIHASFELRDPSFHKPNFPHLSRRTVNADEGDLEKEPNLAVKFMTMFERRAGKGPVRESAVSWVAANSWRSSNWWSR